MKRLFVILITLLTIVVPDAFSTEKKGPVYIVPLTGVIDQPQFYIIRRAFREATANNASAVIIDMNTPGGRLRETEEIISWIRSFNGPVYSFVRKHAQSAGAIICLGSNKIYMAPGSRIGSAAPVLMAPTGGVQEVPETMKEKIMSDTRALVRGLAQENGYPEDLAVAMVDPDHEYKNLGKTISIKGQLLNLTATEAEGLKDKKGNNTFVSAIVGNPQEILAHNNLIGVQVEEFKITAAEKVAKWITMLAPIFLLIGAAGIYIEIKTPGFGVPGLLGITFLLIFFFGHYIAGLAGMEEMLLIILGIVLLAVEIFFIPGFGVTGTIGIILIILGTVMAMLPIIPAEGFEGIRNIKAEYLREALWKFSLFLLLFLTTAWLMAKYLPKTAVFSRLVLSDTTAKGKAFAAIEEGTAGLLNSRGQAISYLRPAGIALINGARMDVVSNGTMIDAGSEIEVIKVEGRRIVVQKVTAPKENDNA